MQPHQRRDMRFVDGDFQAPGGVVTRTRFGLDAQYYHNSLGYFAELNVGEDAGTTDVIRALGEVNWRNSDETVLAWVQLIGTELDDGSGSNSGLSSLAGVRWEPARGWTLSTQYVQVVDPIPSGGARTGTLAVQLRYRF